MSIYDYHIKRKEMKKIEFSKDEWKDCADKLQCDECNSRENLYQLINDTLCALCVEGK